ncbi:MAG TPA: NAD(P)-dependent oxidoreductase [Kofleriaceae bacterium]|nr:NAD(P)-dependent oxidoreductase [Kofleriaceae bacterium]
MRVFVAGATGVIGKPLCKRLVAAGHEVTALTRTEENASRLRTAGVTPVVADIYDRDAVIAAVATARAEAIVHQLTAIPARVPPRQAGRLLEPTNRLRTEGTEILLAAARAAGAKRFIAQSISFVLAPDGPSPAAEEPPWQHPPRAVAGMFDAVAKMEAMLTGAGYLTGVALRFGSLYGPGTIFATGGDMIENIARRRVPIVGRGDGVFGFCHVDDAAAATVCALERGDGVYNIVDDEPAPVRDWLPYLAHLLGAPPPFRVPRWLAWLGAGSYGVYLMVQQRAVSNRKAREELGFVPSIASWRTGFRDRRDT